MTVPFAGRQATLDRSGALAVPSLGIFCASLDSDAMDQGSLFEEVDPLQPLIEAHGRLGGDTAVLLMTGHRACETSAWPGVERLICVGAIGLESFEADGIVFSVPRPYDGEPAVYVAKARNGVGAGFLSSGAQIGLPSLNGPNEQEPPYEPGTRFIALSVIV